MLITVENVPHDVPHNIILVVQSLWLVEDGAPVEPGVEVHSIIVVPLVLGRFLAIKQVLQALVVGLQENKNTMYVRYSWVRNKQTHTTLSKPNFMKFHEVCVLS
jgi:hypothetical protein